MNSRRDDSEAETGKSRPTRRTLVTVAVLALAGIALYAAAGFWIAPRVVERELRTMAREEAGLDLALESVAVNPFTLALSLHNVTLFRGESTPAASIGRLEGRIRGLDPAERSLTLGEVVLRSLTVADPRRRAGLSVPLATADLLVLGADAGPVAIGAPHLDRPHLQLRQGPDGRLAPLSMLVAMPSAAGDTPVTVGVSGASIAVGADGAAPRHLRLGNIDGSIVRREADNEIIMTAALRSRTPGTGSARLTAEWLPLRPRDRMRVELALDAFDLSVVSPWLANLFGRPLRSGRADAEIRLGIENSVLRLDTAMTIGNLRFAPGAEGIGPTGTRRKAGGHIDIDTAIALLKNPQGRLALDIPPVHRRLSSAGVVDVVAASLTDYLSSVADSPFEHLARVVGWPGTRLGSLGFRAGSAEIGDETAAKLSALERALSLRPLIGLTVFPALDERADREALARQQIRLHVNLASSAGIPGEPAPETLDYDDPVVRDVLDEFAANRLSASRRRALPERVPGKDVSYYRAVFEALVDHEEVAMPTLVRLARYRAQAVADALTAAETGEARIRLAEEIVLAAPERGPEVALEVHPLPR